MLQAAQQQSGTAQRDKRESDFGDDQEIVKLAAGERTGSFAALFESGVDVHFADLRGGQKPASDADDSAEGEGKKENSAVEMRSSNGGEGCGGERGHCFDAENSEGNTDCSSQQGEQRAFGKQLAHQAHLIRADGDAESERFAARGISRE